MLGNDLRSRGKRQEVGNDADVGGSRLANQTKGPKVEKVDRAAQAKAEKAAQKLLKKREKAEALAKKRSNRLEEKEEKQAKARAAKAEKEQQREAAKANKEQKPKKGKSKVGADEAAEVSAGAVAAQSDTPDAGGDDSAKAAKGKKKRGKKEKATKVARGDGEAAAPGGKKKIILIAVIALLVLLIVLGAFFLLRMILGGGRDSGASVPDKQIESSSEEMKVGSAGGSQAQNDASAVKDASSSEKGESKASSKEEQKASSQEEKSSSSASKSSSKKEKKSSSSASDQSAEDTGTPTEPVDVIKQAVEGVAGTAEITAMLGSGAVAPEQVEITKDTPTDNAKPGQPAKKVTAESMPSGKQTQGSDKAQPDAKQQAADDTRTALTSTDETQTVPDFKFSEESLRLPAFRYNARTALEAAVHRDIGEYLSKKDDRPGVQVTSVVICGQVPQADGTLRVLTYAWGSRYAIAENTLFDYGNLVGPCALDYAVTQGGYSLKKVTLARGGDAFEASINEMCGNETSIAERMVSQAYDLELHGQMLRNVSTYIQQNQIPVDFFRASGQVYNKDGRIYLPEGTQVEESSSSSGTSSDSASQSSSSEGGSSSDALREEYRVIQDMPQ